MKSGVKFLILLATSTLCLCAQGQRPMGPTPESIIKMDEEWNRAMVARDLAYFGRSLPPDVWFIELRGRSLDKSSLTVALSVTEYRVAQSSNVEIRVEGNTVILTGIRREVVKDVGTGVFVEQRVRYTKVFLLRNKKWEVIVYQEGRFGPT